MTIRPRTVIAALVLLAAHALTGAAAAQQIPERLDARDLDRYARILHLSPEQRNAAYEFYQQYVEEYDEQIGAFEEPVVTEENQPRTYADVQEFMEASLQRRIRLRDQIRALDTQFLAQLDPLLTETQRLNLQRVRDDRLRRTALVHEFFDEVSGFLRSTIPDLSLLIRDMDLTQQELDRVDLIVAEYESRLTSLIRALEPRAMRFCWLDVIEEMVDRGFGDDPRNGDEKRLEEVAVQVWESKGQRAIKLARSIEDLNHRTADRIHDVLDEGNGDAWMHRYHEAVFGSMSPATNALHYIRTSSDALSRVDLSAAQLALIEPLVLEYQRRLRTALDEWVEDARQAIAPDHRFSGTVRWRAFTQRTGKQSDGIQGATLWLKEQLESSLGPDGWTSFYAAWKNIPEASADPTRGFGRPLVLYAGPVEITEGELSHWLDLLDIRDDDRAPLVQAHEEYIYIFRTALSAFDGDRGNPLDPDHLEATTQHDGVLFDAIRSSVQAEDALLVFDAIEDARRRMLLGMYCSGTAGGAVDPVMVLMHSGIESPVIAEALRQAVFDAAQLESLAQQRWDAAHDALVWSELRRERSWTTDEREQWSEATQRRAEANASIAQVQFDLMVRLRKAVGGESGERLWDRYLRLAYGPVANDSRAEHDLLHEAMEREDLTGEQRARLENLVLDYQRRYAELTDELLERAQLAYGFTTDRRTGVLVPSVPIEHWDLRLEYGQIKIERDDLNDFARLQLKLILDPRDGCSP